MVPSNLPENTLNMKFTIYKRWLTFFEPILALFLFRKYLLLLLVRFYMSQKVLVFICTKCVVVVDDSFRILTLYIFCLFRYLTFIYYFKFPGIITGPHFVYSFSFVCGQYEREREAVWQLNFKRKSYMVNGIFMF